MKKIYAYGAFLKGELKEFLNYCSNNKEQSL